MSTFTPIPAQCNLSLDQAYDWHRLYSNEAPAFVYRKESETEVSIRTLLTQVSVDLVLADFDVGYGREWRRQGC